jgi:hypothetical protein
MKSIPILPSGNIHPNCHICASFFWARRARVYDALLDKVMSAIRDPKQMDWYSTPEQITEASQDPQRFFNTAAYVLEPFGAYGNARRNTVTAPA